jgi:hypothetical protein
MHCVSDTARGLSFAIQSTGSHQYDEGHVRQRWLRVRGGYTVSSALT